MSNKKREHAHNSSHHMCLTPNQLHFIGESGFLLSGRSVTVGNLDRRERVFRMSDYVAVTLRIRHDESQLVTYRQHFHRVKSKHCFLRSGVIVILRLSHTRRRSCEAHLLYHVIDAGGYSYERFHFDVHNYYFFKGLIK